MNGSSVRRTIGAALAVALLVTTPATARGGQPELLVVVGAGGEPTYAEMFHSWAMRWIDLGKRNQIATTAIGIHREGTGTIEVASSPSDDADAGADEEASDRERLKSFLQKRGAVAADSVDGPLWIVFIGHGTFRNQVAKFNLEGPDVSAQELATWLAPMARPLVIINSASASGPFINALSSPGRVIVTATRSGNEQGFARFGEYLSTAIDSPEADLDHDDEVSILEAFLRAAGDVSRFYSSEARIATEHALIDDNGDGLGTSASLFRGTRVPDSALKQIQRAKSAGPDDNSSTQVDGTLARRTTLVAGPDPQLGEQAIKQRDDLEAALEGLRSLRASIGDDAYWMQVEPILVELARLYRSTENAP